VKNADELVEHLKREGIKDPLVLEAFRRVPRELFVPEELRHLAYADTALPIGHGQTISQPFTIASMLEMLRLKPGMKVLEIGTGSGYQTAVLIELKTEVYSIERQKELYEKVRKFLPRLGYVAKKLSTIINIICFFVLFFIYSLRKRFN